MTKQVIKWWKNFSFWSKVRIGIASLGVGSEVTLFLMDSFPKWKVFAAAMTALSIVISFLFTDHNNDGVVDAFEN